MRVASGERSASASGTVRIGDITVHRLGYGSMRLTGPGTWGDPPEKREALRVLRRVVELGVDFIDTADFYGLDLGVRAQRGRAVRSG